ncbi:LysR family transcriptional regulator [Actibacterium lipolyticum]|uniref:HTH-type transcriptional regulator CynR n=1 Tax=Actibacterium lipolyticum TaxID=1524263 RepID=A0A238JP52_9RHOB|nr:LysR family transcriptional regulator [Actibacterium lipolyticum]SMX32450.1 HTH-type transcriptional regulator CynR [Actibacterium lipolyticum]
MRHLQLYRALQAVVREGSIRKASELLAISPSALNRQILGLEEELGVPFFERLPSGVRLSTAGEVYFSHFIKHLAEIDRAEATVADLSGLRIGHVKVAVSRELEAGLLSANILSFRREHPRVTFSVVPVLSADFSARLISGQADIALIAQPQYHDGIETVFSTDTAVHAIVARGAVPERATLRPDTLADMDLVLPADGVGFRTHLDQGLKRLRIDTGAAVESAGLIAPWVNEGGRASAQFVLAPAIDDNWLSACSASLHPVARIASVNVVMCKRAGRILPIAAEKFAQQLAASLQQTSADAIQAAV